MSSAIFFMSSTGNTETCAEKISAKLDGIDTFNMANEGVSKIDEYSKLIIGCPTWGEGELQDDLEDAWDEFCQLDFSGKTVALFGLGDQDGYGEYYVDAMGIIYEQIVSKGANVIGFTDIGDEYDFEESKAQIDDKFVGLALDEDNQFDLTDSRIEQWCSQIQSDIL